MTMTILLWGTITMLMKYLMMTIQLEGSNVLPLEGLEKTPEVIKALPNSP